MRKIRFAALLLLVMVGSGVACARKPEGFRFIHSSDTHFNNETKEGSNAANDVERFKEINALKPAAAFMVNTGDTTDHGTDEQYSVRRESLKQLKIPMYDSPGNHDVRWNPLGKEGYVLGVGPLYRSWDHGGVHFVTLDSTVLLQHWGHFDRAELEWLRKDLEKVGTQRPVILGFHHWIGRESVMVDNEQELLKIVEPYNVRLWLQGHGHSDISWNVNGTPAIMQGGLYQGSYSIVDVTPDAMKVTRRHWGKADPAKELMVSTTGPTTTRTGRGGRGARARAASAPATTTTAPAVEAPLPVVVKDVMTIPLARQSKPVWDASMKVVRESALIKIDRGTLPGDTQLAYRFNQQDYTKMYVTASTTQPSTSELVAGEHVLTVQAQLGGARTPAEEKKPDQGERPAYQIQLPFTIEREGAPRAAWTSQVNGAVLSHLVRDRDTLYVTTMGNDLVAIEPKSGKTKWTFSAKDSIFATPHIDGDTIYFGSADHHAYAVDTTTGKERWKYKTKAGIFAGPAVAKGVMAITSTDKTIYGLDAKSGELKWTAPVEGMYQSKAATDGTRFFLGGWDNTLRCLDAVSGKELWATKLGRNIKTGNIQFAFSPAIASPCVGDGKVYVSSNDGMVHALTIEKGEIVWEYSNKRLGYSSPLFHEGRVYVAIGDPSKVFALDAKDGKLLWAIGPRIETVKEEDPKTKKMVDKEIKTLEGVAGQDVTLPVIYDSSAAFGAGNIYIGSVAGTLNCIDAKTGMLEWQYALGPGHVLASPATDEQRVYISSMSGKVTALPLTAGGVVASGK